MASNSNVGPSAKGSSSLNFSDAAFAGAVSGAVTRMICQPLDVLKIRFQLQVESTHSAKAGGHYHGILQSFKRIVKEEGFGALWKGHVSAQCLTIIYSSTQFFCYNSLTYAYANQFNDTLKDKYKLHPGILSACGTVSAICATALSMPFDVARTRIIAQGHKKYSGWPDVWRQMVRNESLFNLWRGFLPTMASSAPYAAIQFPIYTKVMEITDMGNGGLLYRSTVSGILAGFIAKAVIYPLDVFKKRSQMRGAEDTRKALGKVVSYKSSLDILLTVTKTEGVMAWYKGLVPALLKSCSVSAISFMSFELCCQFLKLRHQS